MKVSNSRERIQKLLDDFEINQAEFCRRTGIKKASLSNYLSGKREPRQDAISKIADAFSVSPAWLMGYDGKNIEGLPFDFWNLDETEAFDLIRKSKALYAVYETYGFDAYHIIEIFCNLSEEGKKEILNFVEYMCNKYSISDKLSTQEDLINEYLPQEPN